MMDSWRRCVSSSSSSAKTVKVASAASLDVEADAPRKDKEDPRSTTENGRDPPQLLVSNVKF